MKRAAIVGACLLVLLTACGQETVYTPSGSYHKATESQRPITTSTTSSYTGIGSDILFDADDKDPFSFSYDDAITVSMTTEEANLLRDRIRSVEVNYAQSSYYDLQESERRLSIRPNVSSHAKSALDENGRLTADRLTNLVKENNAAYMATDPVLVELPDDTCIRETCTLITEYVHSGLTMIRAQGVSIDEERVYCNLADLKIISKPGMLDFATVTKDRILYISKNSEQIVTNMYGENAYRNTLVHETMHILQLGCACESIPSCERRAGIAYSYDDFTMNSLDWAWFPEAVAEHSMSRLTGDDPITYASFIKYLNTFHLVTLPVTSVGAHQVDALGFSDDPQALFSPLSSDVVSEREMLCMMITLNVILNQPASFTESYELNHGVTLSTDRDAYNNLYYPMEAACCATLAKCFYANLIQLLSEGNGVSATDLACMLNLFEAAAEGHLRYTKSDYSSYNSSFTDAYAVLRDALFERVTMSNGGDFAVFYESYSLLCADQTLDASVRWCDSERQDLIKYVAAELAYTSYQKVP